jgi:hypothetical protein
MKLTKGIVLKPPRGILLATVCAAVSPAQATTFGTYDPRALAMGGAAVALATPQHAQFYNPALLALHDQRAEESHSGRLYFPLLAIQASDALVKLAELEQDDLVGRIQAAVGTFNATPNRITAMNLREKSADLDSAIDALDGQNLPLEAFAGMAIAEPGQRAGGAFHIGARAIGGGTARITDNDQELLHKYLETLDFFIAGGTGMPPHPELFDSNGDIIDFTGDIESTLSGRGAFIVEWGLSAAREFTLFGQPVALGITPKLMEVRVFQQMASVVRDFSSLDDEKSHLAGNVDLGLAVDYESGLRVGLTVKDVFSQTFSSDRGEEISIRSRSRAGLAYIQPGYAVGLDLDLVENQPVGFEAPVQELALGSELELAHWARLRLGYRVNLGRSDGDAVSFGLGLRVYRFLVDVAYSHGSNHRGGAVQLGVAF